MGSGLLVGTHRVPEKLGIGFQQEKYFWVPGIGQKFWEPMSTGTDEISNHIDP